MKSQRLLTLNLGKLICSKAQFGRFNQLLLDKPAELDIGVNGRGDAVIYGEPTTKNSKAAVRLARKALQGLVG